MSRTFMPALIGLLMLCGTPSDGAGQTTRRDSLREPPSALMTPGAHVRVKLRGEPVWSGTLVSLDGDSMLVHGAAGDDTTLVRLSQVTQLEVSSGRKRSRHLLRNTAIGATLGAGVGWMVGRSRTSGGCNVRDYCWEHAVELYYSGYRNPPVTDRATEGTLIGGVVGGAIAALASRLPKHEWQRVSLGQHRASVALSPRGGSISLAF